MKKVFLAVVMVLVMAVGVGAGTLPFTEPSPIQCNGNNACTTKGDLAVTGDLTVPPSSLTYQGSVYVHGANDFVVDGDCAYITQNANHLESSLTSVSTANKVAPEVVQVIARNSDMPNPHSLVQSGKYLFIANYASGGLGTKKVLTVIEKTAGCRMEQKSSFYHASIPVGYNLAIDGDVLIITAVNNDYIGFIGISNPLSPEFLSVLSTGIDSPWAVYCKRGFCFVNSKDDDTLLSIDARNPKAATVIDTLSITGIGGFDYMDADDQYLYLATSTSMKVVAVDILNPFNMSIAGQSSENAVLSNANSASVFGDYVVATGEGSGTISIWDKKTKSAITYVTSYTDATYTDFLHRAAPYGQYIYFTSTSGSDDSGDSRFGILKFEGLNIAGGSIGSLDSNKIAARDLVVSHDLNSTGTTGLNNLNVTGRFSAQGFAISDNNGTPPEASKSFENANSAAQYISSFLDFRGTQYATGGANASGTAQDLYLRTEPAGSIWASYTHGDNVAGCTGASRCEGFFTSFNYKDVAYFGSGKSNGDAKVYACADSSGGGVATLCDNDADFTEYVPEVPDTESYNYVFAFGVYKRILYLGTGSGTSEGDIHVCNGTQTGACDAEVEWSISYDGNQHSADTTNNIVQNLTVSNNTFYSGFNVSAAGAKIFLYCDDDADIDDGFCIDGTAPEWLPAYTGTIFDTYTAISSAYDDSGTLYVGTGNGAGLASLWRCNPAGGGVATICDNTADWAKVYEFAGTYMVIKTITRWNNLIVFGTAGAAGEGELYSFDGVSAVTKIFDPGVYTAIDSLSVDDKGNLLIGTGEGNDLADIFVMENGTGKVTKYAGKTVEGAGVSSIVKSTSATGQVADITETNLFIPPADGLYKVTIYAVATTTDASDTLDVDILYTDDAAAQTRSNVINALDLGATTPGTAEVIIKANSVDPITYQTDYTDDGGTAAIYSVYITVERLN